MLSPTRRALIYVAAIPLAAWAIVAPSVVGFSGGYSSGLEAFIEDSIVVAVVLTIGALAMVGLAWRGKVRLLYPGLVSALATLAILVPPQAMNLGG